MTAIIVANPQVAQPIRGMPNVAAGTTFAPALRRILTRCALVLLSHTTSSAVNSRCCVHERISSLSGSRCHGAALPRRPRGQANANGQPGAVGFRPSSRLYFLR